MVTASNFQRKNERKTKVNLKVDSEQQTAFMFSLNGLKLKELKQTTVSPKLICSSVSLWPVQSFDSFDPLILD